MQTILKLRLGAVAVIANGLLALTVLSPSPALAAGCVDHDYGAGCGCTQTCATFAGCTLTQACIVINPSICGGGPVTFCEYN